MFLIIGEVASAADRIKIFRRKQGKTDDHKKRPRGNGSGCIHVAPLASRRFPRPLGSAEFDSGSLVKTGVGSSGLFTTKIHATGLSGARSRFQDNFTSALHPNRVHMYKAPASSNLISRRGMQYPIQACRKRDLVVINIRGFTQHNAAGLILNRDIRERRHRDVVSIRQPPCRPPLRLGRYRYCIVVRVWEMCVS